MHIWLLKCYTTPIWISIFSHYESLRLSADHVNLPFFKDDPVLFSVVLSSLILNQSIVDHRLSLWHVGYLSDMVYHCFLLIWERINFSNPTIFLIKTYLRTPNFLSLSKAKFLSFPFLEKHSFQTLFLTVYNAELHHSILLAPWAFKID